MQCVNCGFNNMPGTESCMRCSTSLGIAVATIDVHPPRAGRLSKTLRPVAPIFRRSFYAIRDAGVGNTVDRTRAAAGLLPPRGVFLRLVIPGWSHFYLRQKFRGHAFLWGFLFFLIPGLVIWGSTWGSIWVGMAFSVHSSAALDIVTQHFADAGMRDRIARSIIVSIILFGCLYFPLAMWLSYVADPCTLMMTIGPFHANDVLLVNELATPHRGTMVIYETPYSSTQTTYYREHMTTIYTGETIDRVLAVGGDRVQIDEGQILVNGFPTKYWPMVPGRLPKKLDMRVPDDNYLVLPSATPGAHGFDNAGDWTNTFCVSRSNIVGSVYLRTSPLSSWRIVR
jgi:hypothetical protein